VTKVRLGGGGICGCAGQWAATSRAVATFLSVFRSVACLWRVNFEYRGFLHCMRISISTGIAPHLMGRIASGNFRLPLALFRVL
jgi:hypothetical protein